ncbi:MAG: Asp-tRNA(Asn)/Glu-tRNA(Gln) amidotransferase subunit GatA [Lachnospiraceae bacterium]|nr:Asp-tRNA(Asn)/Glu-tRNA(Gln) amidotransferase subunit GatA [Lachnospiraceae bacterium]
MITNSVTDIVENSVTHSVAPSITHSVAPSALELAALLKAKKISVAEVLDHYFGAIEKTDPHLNSFLALAKESALAQAKIVQEKLNLNETLSSLAGVPIAIKDNISTQGIKTACASKMLDGYVPVYDASVVTKLKQAGMIVIGKLNMDEFAMGGSSETGIGGPVHNPWDLSRVAGGSSGGSAAAVAARLVPLALGSDTGGSIRQPCSFCGITGIKPTYGAVSRYGLIAYASSLDQIGPMGVNIDDCAALLKIISGPCEKDSTWVLDKPFDFKESQPNRLDGVKIGLPINYFADGIDKEVAESVLRAAKEFENAGATICEFEMPLLDYVIPTYYIIACAEASSNLSRYDGLKYGHLSKNANTLDEIYRLSRSEGFGIETKRRIMLGSFVLSSGYYEAYYQKALKARALLKKAYDQLFEQYNFIISPVAPTSAYRHGENITDPLKMYIADLYTVGANLAGLPAVSLPCGFDSEGLPLGFQLCGNAFKEADLIMASRVYQARTGHHLKKPEVDF